MNRVSQYPDLKNRSVLPEGDSEVGEGSQVQLRTVVDQLDNKTIRCEYKRKGKGKGEKDIGS